MHHCDGFVVVVVVLKLVLVSLLFLCGVKLVSDDVEVLRVVELVST